VVGVVRGFMCGYHVGWYRKILLSTVFPTFRSPIGALGTNCIMMAARQERPPPDTISAVGDTKGRNAEEITISVDTARGNRVVFGSALTWVALPAPVLKPASSVWPQSPPDTKYGLQYRDTVESLSLPCLSLINFDS
jgi:hypothetical protein